MKLGFYKRMINGFKDFRKDLSATGKSRAVFLGSLSTAFEWYDYALFGYFALLIGEQFFPATDPATALLSSFAVFASGFAMRPLGALLFGAIGDRVGRKKALTLSLFLMAFPTTLLGLLPNYEAIGIWASLGLVGIRLLQGVAIGGNYGGSFIFAIEHTPQGRKGLAGGLAMFGTLGGLFLGSGVASLVAFLSTPETLSAYAWRIPFLLGIFSALVSYIIHRYVPEIYQKEESVYRFPIQEVLKFHLKPLLLVMGVILLDGVGVYVLFVFITSYAHVFLKLPEDASMLINTITMGSLVFFIPIFAWLGDRITQRRVLMWVCAGFIVLSPILFSWLISEPSLFRLAILQSVFAIIVGAAYGALPSMVVGSFPQNIRYTSCGIAFNVSVALFGGTAPLLMTALIRQTNSLYIPAVFLMFVGVIAGLCVHYVAKKRYS